VVSPGDDVLIEDIMQFTVTGATGWARSKIPTNLRPTNPILPLPRPANIKKRYVTLVEIMGADGVPAMALLNNRRFDTTDIEEVKVDTVEEWNIINTTADTHPIHLHLIGFQVAERQAFDVDGYLQATYGTVALGVPNVGSGPWPPRHPGNSSPGRSCRAGRSRPDGRTPSRSIPDMSLACSCPSAHRPPRLAVRPSAQANPFTGDYLWHCHILDHEDNDMMLPYKVTR
jgi:FtsP/CotA-like multicopper oxidase with cupredoxin domain